jgi:hypothetical protein
MPAPYTITLTLALTDAVALESTLWWAARAHENEVEVYTRSDCPRTAAFSLARQRDAERLHELVVAAVDAGKCLPVANGPVVPTVSSEPAHLGGDDSDRD